MAAGPRVLGAPAYAIHRIGGSTPGDFVSFDTDDPGGGVLIGNVGFGNVGTMDFFAGDLWAVSGDNNVLSFYTIDTATAQATFRSSFGGPFGGTSVFSGSFDNNGYYWVTDFSTDVIRKLDPLTGASLFSAPIAPSAGPNGIAFVGDTLYAVHGGFGDPLQEFGTLNTQTGVFDLIGLTGVGVGGMGGGNGTGALDYDPVTDTMYLVYRAGIQPGQLWSLYTVDLATGGATFVGEIQPERNYDAFAVLPEPASLTLLLGALLGGGRRSRARR
ncbi:MAG: hypothetical protein ACE5GE_06645 [Phycisphaerae bacterium]